VNIGLRSIVMIAAVVVFVVAIFVDKNQLKWIAAGLALFSGAFALGGVNTGVGARLRRRL